MLYGIGMFGIFVVAFGGGGDNMQKMSRMMNILDGIGNTPLVKLGRLDTGRGVVWAKMESANPGGSVKDRVALAMVEAAERDGRLAPGGLLVEPTSGNTGIGLALVAAVKGYSLVLTMPDTMSVERRKLLAAYGAKVVLTEGAKGMAGAIAKAQAICRETPGAWMPQQFENPANPEIHRKTTGPEIWRDLEGGVDAFVAGVGTGGTVTGVGEFLKSKNSAVRIVAVEPDTSAVLSGKPAGPHALQGIGAGFVPTVLNRAILDEVIPVGREEAGHWAREAAHKEGLLIGISGGAALAAGLNVARRAEMAGKNVVVLMPDGGDRYLSSWLFDSNA